MARVKNEFSFMRGNLLTLISTWLFFYFGFCTITDKNVSSIHQAVD
ncbi:MAG TPA: hypothetical protein VJ066_04930 [Candidatus Bathyarchaeia archaeon]|nr:hypothetical protein [Candidatus Bathyarchaeia archaeon]